MKVFLRCGAKVPEICKLPVQTYQAKGEGGNSIGSVCRAKALA